jgi:hypothetical protein
MGRLGVVLVVVEDGGYEPLPIWIPRRSIEFDILVELFLLKSGFRLNYVKVHILTHVCKTMWNLEFIETSAAGLIYYQFKCTRASNIRHTFSFLLIHIYIYYMSLWWNLLQVHLNKHMLTTILTIHTVKFVYSEVQETPDLSFIA